jgi:uncharacterized protein YcnI
MRKNCLVLALTLFSVATASFAHIVLDEPAALAGRGYKAALRVGHGCNGSPTTAIKVLIPVGFQGAKPMPKAGWTLSTTVAKLAKPYDSHGRTITEDVAEISWTASSKDSWLPDAWFDEFVLRGGLSTDAGAMWFKVLQTCEKGRNDWVQVPTSGISTRGLKAPAALLEIIESGPAGHQH